jgi:uncharacterized phiE125 gp8 family phage protein
MAIPVTLEDARRQIQLGEGDWYQDINLAQSIEDAAAWVEEYTGHILVARDVTETFYGVGAARLKAWPVRAASVPTVAYVNASGATVAIEGAGLDASSRPARVLLPPNVLDSFCGSKQSFTVTIRAGYEPKDAVPGNFRRAMLILISAYDSDREGGELFQKAEASARRLCGRLRSRRL